MLKLNRTPEGGPYASWTFLVDARDGRGTRVSRQVKIKCVQAFDEETGEPDGWTYGMDSSDEFGNDVFEDFGIGCTWQEAMKEAIVALTEGTKWMAEG